MALILAILVLSPVWTRSIPRLANFQPRSSDSQSLMMLTAAIPSIFAGNLADKLGRLRGILIGTILFTIGVVIECSAKNLPTFNIGRGLAGLG
jgi:MFS family permease